MRVKSEAKRQAILAVARESFTRHGFETTSMSAIASEVGGSKATLYNHFSSKEALFEAVMLDFGQRMRILDTFSDSDLPGSWYLSYCSWGGIICASCCTPM